MGGGLLPPAPPDTEVRWFNMFEVEAVTGADGVATAKVPFDTTLYGLSTTDGWLFRVMATYDGGPGLYARHAASPVTIGPA